jgi:hypothetical protein
MCIRESKTSAGYRVQVRSFYCSSAITADVPIPDIVRIDENDIGEALSGLLRSHSASRATGTDGLKELSTIHKYPCKSSAIILSLI